MIVKNEEKNLERTLVPLKKLQDYIDTEIVIVDTGSTDSTVGIAKKYTNKVYFHEWNNDFGAMRNMSISYCIGEWILVVDADEVLYDVKALAQLIKSNSFNKFNAALIKIIDFNKDVEYSLKFGISSPLLRLFRKNTIAYEGIVHEQPQFKYPVTDSKIRFIHYGYINDDFQLMEYKYKRNLDLLFKQLERDPNNIYTNFQIAASYSMHKEQKEALKYIEKAYNACKDSIEKYMYVIAKYCFILYNMRNFNELEKKSLEAIKYCDDFLDFYFYLGQSYYNLKEYHKASIAYEKYTYIYDNMEEQNFVLNSTLSILTRKYKDTISYNLAICYYKRELYEKALNKLLELQDEAIIKDKIHVIFKIIFEGKLWNKIQVVEKFVDKYNYESILLYIHDKVSINDLKSINLKYKGTISETIGLIKYFKQNENYDKEHIDKIKNKINKTNIPYSIFIYYILKYNINELEYLVKYGKDKIENVLINLANSNFDMNQILIDGLDKIKYNSMLNITIRTIIEKALLLGGNLPQHIKKQLFVNYISEKYYTIIKTYDNKIIKENLWILNSEERFIIELKKALSYKHKDALKYIKYMKDILKEEKSYIDYVKLLIEDDKEFINNNEIKALIPELIKNIQAIIYEEKYQEAYNTIEEALRLIRFDFDVMIFKFELLMKFGYLKEAQECLIEIILYGDEYRVNKFLLENY
ncbi:MAG: glycosyltransferase family 2 protein [Clostridiaceae bacterium]